MFKRYSIIKQNDESDCGAACLATVALHYRIPVGLEKLRDLSRTDRDGASLLGLRNAAEELGFAARAVRGPLEALASVPLPAIAHVRSEEGLGHFIVVHEVRKRSVVVADPRHGLVKLTRDAFADCWTGHLLLLFPDHSGQATDSTGRPWRRFLDLLGAHRAVLFEAFVCAILMTLLGISTSYFIQHLVDSVLVRGEGRLLNALGIGMALILVFRTSLGMLRQYLLAHLGRKIDLTLMSAYIRHFLRLPLRFFETRRVGEILSRVQDSSKVREAISGTTLTAVVDGTLVLVVMAVLWTHDPVLALVGTAFVPLLVASVVAHHPASRRKSREAMENGARYSAHVVEDISGVETIKAFGVERHRAEKAELRVVRFAQSLFSLEKFGISMNASGGFLTGLAGLVILWLGGHRVAGGALTVGELLFFYTLLGYMLEPLNRLASVNLQIQEALVAVDRLYQVLDLETESSGSTRRVALSGVREGIELRGVGFRYGHRDKVLDGVSLRIPAGKTVAIVGESGSGKSTLLKLLMGFYTATEGELSVDGTDMRDLELASLRNCIGLVSQEPFVFNGTIAENIALGRPGAPLAEIVAAARAADLHEFISRLPERYETLIGERGGNLSGGQRQRLAIARALLKQPDVLIFDEATSHLDTATERTIQESLKTSSGGSTVVLVAHRLSTVQEADVIYVLDQGKVVEEGTHRQLLARRGRYAELCRAQSEANDLESAPPLHAVKGACYHETEGVSRACRLCS